MKLKFSLETIGVLVLGFVLGLGLVLVGGAMFGEVPNWLGRSEDPTIASKAPIGALGPLVLDWPEQVAPAPDSFLIDDTVNVTVTLEAGQLSLAPVLPLTAGVHTLRFRTEQGRVSEWSFVVRQPEPLYLRDLSGQTSLFRWNEGDPILLSGDKAVVEYAPSRQGNWLAFSTANAQGGRDIWRVDRDGHSAQLLMDCGPERCGHLAWNPVGDRLVFSRWPADDPDQPRLWTVRPVDPVASPLFQDRGVLGKDPVWSPDGRWLAFYDPAANGIRLLDADTLNQEVVPSRAGVSGAWSADSRFLFLPLIVYSEEEPSTYLYRLQVGTRNLEEILGEEGGWRQVGEPSLGLDGRWLAISAQRGSSGATPEIWLVELAGYEPRRLASEEGVAYGGPSWDASGQQLLFQRFARSGTSRSPDLMIWRQGQAAPELLQSGAGSADWLH